ncbi:MAG: glycoside hydrolase family 3 N-terminal domain-containing protein, partial [Bacteroidota bacterium]|nr:glycoside hydrolase family 3 N-terminal domain-containing protein [Bacteroidota bacterium]
MKRIFSILIVFIALIGRAYAQPDFAKLINHQWVDSVYRSLTPDERIAQLVWIAATSDDNITHQMNIAEMVRMIHPGGIIFFEGEVKRQIKLTNYYQSLSKTPLVIAMDAEWGPGMRLDNTISLPYAMALGAVQENALLVRSGEEIGRQLRRIGVHFNLAPDADINTEPLNPIIGMRSFGEVPEKVSQCALSMMQGMLKQRVIPVAKHFPGHGDTRNDSHLSLPVVPFDRERLDKVEFYPFKELIKSGLPAIMTAHLHVPALDSGQNIPASLSPIITNNLLRKEWGFKGLILTDAMNMGGVLSYGKPGLIDVLALKAGNDVIEFPADPKASIQAIKEALKSGQLSWKDIELKCRRVLAAKYWCGLNHYQPVNLANIDQELNTPESALLNRELSEASLTLIENKDNIIPLMNLDTLQIATLSIGTDSLTQFQKTLSLYSRADHYNLPDKFTKVQGDLMLKKLNKYNLVLVGVHNLYETAIRKTVKVGNIKHLKPERPYNVTAELEQFISVLSINKKTIFTLFGNPYALAEFKNFVRPNALLVSYQDNSNNEDLSAQLIFGGIKAKGKLPVSVTGLYTAGTGFTTPDPIRFKYTLPEEVGYDSQRITQKVDSIVTRALELKAFPGCQILVAKDRKVIFRKEYGYHTFDHTIPVKPDDIYDLASITKITGPLPAYIKLYDEGKFKFDDRFSNYWPDWKSRLFHKSNKEDL